MSIDNKENGVKDQRDPLEEEFVLVGKDDKRVEKRRVFAMFTVILLLVAFGSFGLGRLSSYQDQKAPTTIRMSDQSVPMQNSVLGASSGSSLVTEETEPANTGAGGGAVVASKNSDKYHYPWCSGAKNISEANKITFSSIEEAKKAGYKPASNCKGLK
ncbi:MAG: hypothetical protein A2653_02395 [Candidatus Zambryskibacteria bacterium RIFCSPHIGHO2_01_FULL_43_25]|uniref:Ada DNA repair metal-binding domain-containing protein n=1 Tax=Candidatus Zambryskibacteria bacterium RIFCSPLOWO2_01_FULL_45_21 TaxID=1802761 RepID=A0A1G2U310_9BACT|nr:MAG: hypothetical protein A2653_02395 [Candidatus Zambryskibacteria bacterium RIFCSPHIGHO2_01_FULL_43_25]OHB01049.1 MAG: hypothetical protein A3E94_02575 [Candidatus Zambryskibacteria bacterium RIFCSPHIGHO2_12_FULL_44_12b]OHB03906.1 MAG: hypothetical protein A3B14_01055 [Candidatus Zambryskibacteria bacterium RIFCSPLOWO2_01_FULL_45_21]